MAVSSFVCLGNRIGDRIVRLEIENDSLTTRVGHPDKPCVSIQLMGNGDYLKSHFDYVENKLRSFGYSDCEVPDLMTDGSLAEVIWTNEIPADSKFNSVSEDIGRALGSDRAWHIAHFKDGLSFDGDFSFGMLGLVGIASGGVIVEGAITINGVLYITGDEGPVSVRIYGDVTAQSLINTNTITQISGDLEVAQTVLGTSNDGELSIFGTVHAEAVVADDQVVFAKDYDSFRYDITHATDMAWIDPDMVHHDNGVPEFPDRDAIWGRISEGRSILAEGATR